MKNTPPPSQPEKRSPDHVYVASPLFVKGFYVVLALWSCFCLVLLHSILENMGLAPLYGLIMIAFLLVYMWYFSLAFAYRIEVWRDGTIRMTSHRRTLTLRAQEIPKVLGPRFPVGFVKFRLEREMGYLFYQAENADLKRVLQIIRSANPGIQFTNL